MNWRIGCLFSFCFVAGFVGIGCSSDDEQTKDPEPTCEEGSVLCENVDGIGYMKVCHNNQYSVSCEGHQCVDDKNCGSCTTKAESLGKCYVVNTDGSVADGSCHRNKLQCGRCQDDSYCNNAVGYRKCVEGVYREQILASAAVECDENAPEQGVICKDGRYYLNGKWNASPKCPVSDGL